MCGGGVGESYQPRTIKSFKNHFWRVLDLVDIGGTQSYGSGWKTQIFSKFGVFVIEIPKKRNFDIFWIFGEFVF